MRTCMHTLFLSFILLILVDPSVASHLLPSAAIPSNCVVVKFVADAKQQSPLLPIVSRDLLAEASRSTAFRNRDMTDKWSRWMFHDHRERNAIMRQLGASTPTPIGNGDGRLSLHLILHPLAHNPAIPWLTLTCQSLNNGGDSYHNNPLEASRAAELVCTDQFLALGHPYSPWPTGFFGFTWTFDISRVDLTASSSIWQHTSNNAQPTMALDAWASTPQYFYMRYCSNAETTTDRATSIETTVEPDETGILRASNLAPSRHYRVLPGSQRDEWCIVNVNVSGSNCRICLSPHLTKHHIYWQQSDYEGLAKRLIIRFPEHDDYLLVLPPYHIEYGASECLIILDQSTTRQIVRGFETTRTYNHSIHLGGLSRRAEDAISNNAHITSAPELGVLRAIWMLIIATILIRRIVTNNDILAIVYLLRCFARGTPNSAHLVNQLESEGIIPIQRSLVHTDSLLLIIFIITTIWYGVELSQSLPPAPTYATFYVVNVLVAIEGLVILAVLIITSLQTYSGFLNYAYDGAMRLCFCCFKQSGRRPHEHDSIVFDERIRTGLWVASLQRVSGYTVGIVALLYSMWWDTDDNYHWCILSILLASLYLLMADHVITSLAISCILRSLSLAIYSVVIGVGAGLLLVYSINDIWQPLFVTLAAGVYSDDTIYWMIWLTMIVFTGLIFATTSWPVQRVKEGLHEKVKEELEKLTKKLA